MYELHKKIRKFIETKKYDKYPMWKTSKQNSGKNRKKQSFAQSYPLYPHNVDKINVEKCRINKQMFWLLVINQQKVEEMWKKYLTF